jgi:hypothetical protein
MASWLLLPDDGRLNNIYIAISFSAAELFLAVCVVQYDFPAWPKECR